MLRPQNERRHRGAGWAGAAALLLLLAGTALAQEPREGEPAPAAPEAPTAPRVAVPLRALSPAERLRLEGQDGCFDAEGWRARLTDPDLDRREQAFGDLVDQLGRCAQAVRALEAWAASSREPELSWTARMALRALRSRPRALVLRTIPGAAVGLDGPIAIDLGDPGRVGAQLELLEGPLQALFQSGSELSLYAPRQLVFQGPPPAVERQRQFSVEAGPQQVTLRITESGGGEERTREFSAPDLAELLEQHPELAEEVPGLSDMAVQSLGGGQVSMRWSTGPVRLRFDPFGLNQRPHKIAVLGVDLSTDAPTMALGVDCRGLTDEERAHRDLSPGLGVLVDLVWPGGVAHVVELKRGDILLRIDSRDLRECADITRALAARPADAPLTIELLDTEGQRRTVTWNPR
jgi:hypothetical protein